MTTKKTFEQAMGELEGVVRRLEGSDTGLEESLKEFENGVGLVRECETKLEEAKSKIEKLVKQADGTVKLENFDVQN